MEKSYMADVINNGRENMDQTILKGVQAYTDTLLNAVNPIPKVDRAFLAVALKSFYVTIMQDLDEKDMEIYAIVDGAIGFESGVNVDEQDS